mmetsp:Transcript_3676/g.6462  ORF Transcript_3676/g.6462 Transcript_3676/m.6462 type:complete len:86 (-) Transcript_3676:545-802(-)
MGLKEAQRQAQPVVEALAQVRKTKVPTGQGQEQQHLEHILLLGEPELSLEPKPITLILASRIQHCHQWHLPFALQAVDQEQRRVP